LRGENEPPEEAGGGGGESDVAYSLEGRQNGQTEEEESNTLATNNVATTKLYAKRILT